MKLYFILFYKNEADTAASQEEVNAFTFSEAIRLFNEKTNYQYEPFLAYHTNIRAMFQSNLIPSSLQKDISHE